MQSAISNLKTTYRIKHTKSFKKVLEKKKKKKKQKKKRDSGESHVQDGDVRWNAQKRTLGVATNLDANEVGLRDT